MELSTEERLIVAAAIRFCIEDIGETGGKIKGIPGEGQEAIETLWPLYHKLAD